MEYKRGTEFAVSNETAVSIGKFDGVHLGHKKLLEKIMDKKKEGLDTAFFTFYTTPGRLPSGERTKVLTTNEERIGLIEKTGVDYLFQWEFSKEKAKMEPEDFVKDVLVDQLKIRFLAVGSDFRFGYKKKGDIPLLRELALKYGFSLEVVEKEKHEFRDISSTFAKEEVAKGNIEKANSLLGYPYMISGQVEHGKKLGRTLGLPTANLIPPEEKLLPPNGVYASRTLVRDKEYEGVTNIGLRPTVSGEKKLSVETYLFDFDEEIYGEQIEVKLYTFERSEEKFSSLERLKERIEKDIIFGKKYFRECKRNHK